MQPAGGRIGVVYKSDPVRGQVWERIFAQEAPEMELRLWPDIGDSSEVRYLVAWLPPDDLPRRFPRLEVLFSTGAGIDQLNFAGLPPHVAVVRMVDPDLTASMADYAIFGVLALHRDIPFYLDAQRQGRWAPRQVSRAADRTVGIMGLGVMGLALARACRDLASACVAGARHARPSPEWAASPGRRSFAPSSPVARSSSAFSR